MPRRPSACPAVRALLLATALVAAAPVATAAQDDGPDAPDQEDTWLDRGHSFIGERIFAPVVAFDRFFSDEHDLELERARSFLQFRSELRIDQSGALSYSPSVRANLRMPGMNAWLRRFRLVVEGQARDAYTALFPGSQPGDAVGAANAEVRFGLWDGLVSHVDLGAGALLRLPPGAFTRMRLRVAFPVGELFLVRFATSGFWRTDTRLGTSAEAYLERPVTRTSILRLANDAQLTQRSRGTEWGSELAWLVAPSPRTALAMLAGVRGATAGPSPVERYRVATRFRRDVLRDWIFYELEPEVSWPLTPLGTRPATFAVTLRLDVQFHGTERAAPPPAPLPVGAPPAGALAEPADAPPARADALPTGPDPVDPPRAAN